LPDSTSDEPGSHGFVKFSFVPSSSLMLGESVGNMANIYFDLNDPVVTNEAFFTIEQSTVVEETSALFSGVWPNPTGGQLFIPDTQAGQRLEVCDLAGRVVHQERSSAGLSMLDVSDLSAGSYTVRSVGNGKVSVRSFIKR
ncbi:MAG TPA: T9SS type A sorting domain-containing protein, partial [Flavobacteriales bacterium]|nr:T9SS type A sorting domain-containing protein [Flavobacteriales bacterium]